MKFSRRRSIRTSSQQLSRATLEALESRKMLTAAVWTGAGTDSLFSDAANWQGDVVPTAGQDVTFPLFVTNTTVTVDTNVTLGNVEFDSGYTLNFPESGATTITLDGNITDTAGTTTISNPIVLGQTTNALVYEAANLSLLGVVSDGGSGFGITQTGNGPLTLSGSGDTYTGDTDVEGGPLFALAPLASNVVVFSNSSFTGDSSVASLSAGAATITTTDAGTAGTVTSTNGLTLADNSGNTVSFYIGGPSDSSQFVVNGGTINLGNATLSATVTNGYTPTAGDVITLIKNNTGSAVAGTFDGLAQGATTTINGASYTVSYTGGVSGQDVTLTAVGSVPVITGTSGTTSTHGFTAAASVTATDTSGASNLTYTWTAVHLPPGAKTPTYSVNGTNAAKSVTFRFFKDGTYIFQCTVKNAAGHTATVDIYAIVGQKATSLKIEPHGAKVAKDGHEQFVTSVLDQFGHPMRAAQAIAYSVLKGHGSINSTGLFTATATAGAVTIEAEDGKLLGTDGLTVT